MDGDLKWIIGLSVGLLVSFTGMIIAAFNNLHSRVNRIRDELGSDFVRKDDLDGHLTRIEKNIDNLRSEAAAAQKQTHERLDKIITSVGGAK
jgi:uncharacterized protein YicC (UPF0701 family)